jgi:hypothetical protein
VTTRTRCLTTTLLALALAAAGCGGDDDDAAEDSTTALAAPNGGSSEGELHDYCALATEMNAGDFPTVAQLTSYKELAPAGIQDQVASAVPAFIDAVEAGNPQSAFADPAVGAAIDAISAFEIETCGPEVAGDDADQGASGPVDAKFADWCGVAAQLDDAPSEELLHAAETNAPDEISDDIDVVVAAFRQGLAAGDPGLGLVRKSYEHIVVINTFNAEHCGIPQDPGDFQDPAITEPDPAAAQVTVSATEFAFAFDPPAAGRTTFNMTNDGEVAHVMVILQAAKGFTAEQAFGSEDDDAVAAFYGSYVAPSGEKAVLTIDLVPGEYMMFCYIPNMDGTPHLAHGMTKAFTVR